MPAQMLCKAFGQIRISATCKTYSNHYKALDTPSIELRGSVEIDELYISAGLKGCEHDGPSRSQVT